MNKVIEIGRSTKDVELKQTTSGTSVVELSIAVKREFKNASGEYESDFFTCIAYGKLAETISVYVKKGDMIGVVGRLQTRNYTNREGKKIYVTEIIVENVEFLQTKRDEKPTNGVKKTDTDPFNEPKWEEVDLDEGLPF